MIEIRHEVAVIRKYDIRVRGSREVFEFSKLSMKIFQNLVLVKYLSCKKVQ